MTDKITLIGDAHGKVKTLYFIQRKTERSIQLGDLGCGFVKVMEWPEQHKFIRGNHDDPAIARTHPNYLGDFGYLPDEKIFYIGGADSIDKDIRIQGVDWWQDEELSFGDFDKVIELYKEIKPPIVISHECPASANEVLLKSLMGDYFLMKGVLKSSRTCQAMQTLLEIHQPNLWVFGHYHIDKTFKIGNGVKTKFQCLGELQIKELFYKDYWNKE